MDDGDLLNCSLCQKLLLVDGVNAVGWKCLHIEGHLPVYFCPACYLEWKKDHNVFEVNGD